MFLKKSKESWRLIPVDGEFFSKVMGNIILGLFQRFAGYFDESELNFQVASKVAEKYESLYQVTPLSTLVS